MVTTHFKNYVMNVFQRSWYTWVTHCHGAFISSIISIKVVKFLSRLSHKDLPIVNTKTRLLLSMFAGLHPHQSLV